LFIYDIEEYDEIYLSLKTEIADDIPKMHQPKTFVQSVKIDINSFQDVQIKNPETHKILIKKSDITEFIY